MNDERKRLKATLLAGTLEDASRRLGYLEGRRDEARERRRPDPVEVIGAAVIVLLLVATGYHLGANDAPRQCDATQEVRR